MQYMLLIYDNEAELAKRSEQDMGQVMAAYGAYTEALKKAGALVSADRLKPIATATTVRVADGKTQVLNGPYAETKEQLGGYYLIEAPDLDAAIAWAARCPGAGLGTMEVRPVWQM
ncbi:MAG: YciI family protein [Rhizomicrobium sp.]